MAQSTTASKQRSQLLICSFFSVKINEIFLNNSVLKKKRLYEASNELCDLRQISESLWAMV